MTDSRVSAAEVESARREWADGERRLAEESREELEAARLLAQLEVVTDELRRRVGGTFTLAELTRVYAGAESWSREVVSQQAPFPGWPRTLSIVEAAAFYRYARGALDYVP